MFNLAKQWTRTWSEVKAKQTWLERIRNFSGRTQFEIENDDFVVSVARYGHELLRILELRHEVFVQEWQGRTAGHGLDIDEFDFAADHLMIIDKKINEVVGTYRLTSSQWADSFYTEGEFDLSSFLAKPQVKVELGRACIHSEYRDGRTIDMLWRGLGKYIEQIGARYLFGCASIKTMDPQLIAQLLNNTAIKDQWQDSLKIRPTKKYQMPGFQFLHGAPEIDAKALMPALLRSYLSAGAQIHGFPALDRDFACTDIVTILDVSQLTPRYKARYFSSFERGYVDLRSIRGGAV